MSEQEKREVRILIRSSIDDISNISDALRHLTEVMKELTEKVLTKQEEHKCTCCKH